MKLLIKLIYILILQGISILHLSAQKHDYQWLFGYENRGAVSDTDFGGVTVDFNYATPQVTKKIRLADFDEDNVSYCDNDGRLLFYSNGGDIFDNRDSIMLNGDSISFGQYWYDQLIGPDNRYGGLRILQGMLALPAPIDTNYVYLFHYPERDITEVGGIINGITDTFYYSLINLAENNGFGKTVKKNIKINSDSLVYSELSAVQHGNGRDWWIIHPYYNGNCYYKFLLTDTGVSLFDIQCIGEPQLQSSSLGTSCFSMNGEKYFWVNAYDGIHMFGFDRCTGELSNPQIIPFPYPISADTSGVASSGIAISPNGRYMYIASTILMLQYDLDAPDIGASVDTVAIWDGSYDPYPFANTFFIEQLGPDGKIYINSNNGVKSLGVINNPDKPGDSCNITQHSFYLHTYNGFSLPNFPNYRQGSLTGSPCDSLNTMTTDLRAEKERILKMYPNPATDYAIVDYGFTDWTQGNVSMEITDALGRIICKQELPMYSGYQKLDVSQFASGIYNVAIKRNGAVIAVAKLVKE